MRCGLTIFSPVKIGDSAVAQHVSQTSKTKIGDSVVAQHVSRKIKSEIVDRAVAMHIAAFPVELHWHESSAGILRPMVKDHRTQ